ncbi:MAG: DegT/DnrJ/EryC1/StrS family aminotransferase, partial [Blastocatellia bacterium]|nr:DegT/DnrJ/EryC1/StrS family aminotransferase [Blastocatellia bacterium]
TAYRKIHQSQDLANTEFYSASELTLPLYPKMRKEDVKEIADSVIAALC